MLRAIRDLAMSDGVPFTTAAASPSRTDFTWDIPENQILRQVVHELSGWGFAAPTRRRLAMLDSALAEVFPGPP